MIQTVQPMENHTLIQVPVQKPIIDPAADFAILHYLRIIFYVFIVIKLIEIVFMRRRKLKISERIQRKFMFAHGIEMIKGFSAEEFQLMNLTLQNTLKNAIQPLSANTKKQQSKIKKNVSFFVQSNVYYDPPQIKSSASLDLLSSAADVLDAEGGDKKLEGQSESLPLISEKQAGM